MKRAVELGCYYLQTYLWLINKNGRQKLQLEAYLLYDWLSHSPLFKDKKITLTKILQNSPRNINARSKTKALKLLAVLIDTMNIKVTEHNAHSEQIQWELLPLTTSSIHI